MTPLARLAIVVSSRYNDGGRARTAKVRNLEPRTKIACQTLAENTQTLLAHELCTHHERRASLVFHAAPLPLAGLCTRLAKGGSSLQCSLCLVTGQTGKYTWTHPHVFVFCVLLPSWKDNCTEIEDRFTPLDRLKALVHLQAQHGRAHWRGPRGFLCCYEKTTGS